MNYKRLWLALSAVIIGSLAVLGYYGWQIYQMAPPIPERVISASGEVIFTGEQIHDGQNVWQSIGGQEVGTVWGHGAYVAPDWSADWLHRELVSMLDTMSIKESGKPYAELDAPAQASLRARLKQDVRSNTFDPKSRDIVVSEVRAAAIKTVATHYTALFSNDADPAVAKLRNAYAIPPNSVHDPERLKDLNAFFFWAAWACATERPNDKVTYTQNWPAEELIDNRPSGQLIVWSVISFVVLLAGIGALSWHSAVQKHKEDAAGETNVVPHEDPLLLLRPTPSMRATLKYFWIVAALIVLQVGLGAVTAHYGVEGNGFYGIPLSKWLPYSITRTWHTQLGIFWIATAWLATGLFVAPAVSGHEPKFQRFGVNFLFVCLLVIVGGSMVGQVLGVQQKLSFTMNHWFGHQGLEYVDLGRFWQWFLFVGLFVWLFLMSRALWPVLKKPGEHRHLLGLFLLASAAIALFYGAGLMWGHRTNLAMIEYWRWWVVHLWVEGFFEVFATVVIAFLFVRMGLLKSGSASRAVLFATVIFLGGGMIGTFHHLYFTGTPVAIIALGATFSALEVVPLVLIGFEAYENLTLSRIKPWVRAYKWPIYFFVSVAFWNLVGAGLFGFFINPPIALYYMQGLNTTPVHGHTALFGVYGMLGIGLMLFCLRVLMPTKVWKDGHLSFTFWSINIGLTLMVLLSLLPVGLMQAWASVEHGMWYARSAEFMQTPLMHRLRWMRLFGDTIFAFGSISLAWFVVGLKTGWSLTDKLEDISLSNRKTADRVK